jgi:hypothetical protein
MIFNLGAPSQLDTFDMKPDAPSEIRGPFKPIKTQSRHPNLRNFSVARETGRQVLARQELLSHSGGRA